MKKPLIFRSMYVYRRGLIIGGLVGAVYAWWLIHNDYSNLAQVFQAGKTLLDSWMARSAPAEIETAKIYAFFTSFGMAAGWLIEFILVRTFMKPRGG